jgi:anaerobic ribonucleoside-triphosphate reductase activating protein
MPRSRANGPGLRAALWLQGCTLACPGCFNPETHPAAGGTLHSAAALAAEIAALPDIEGLTVLGGEPLQQIPALTAFLSALRTRSSLSIILFTGFEPVEIQRLPGAPELLALCDVLIAGRFRQEQVVAVDLRGSANKQVIFLTSRYKSADFTGLVPAEIWINPDGSVALSGITPFRP